MKSRAGPLVRAVLVSLLGHAGLFLLLLILPASHSEELAVVDPVGFGDDLRLCLAPPEPPRPPVQPPPTQEPEATLINPSPQPTPLPEFVETGTPGGGVRLVSTTSGDPGQPGRSREGGGGELAGLASGATSVVFVLDRSVSMGPSGALARARQELIGCLHSLRQTVRFQVIPYNRAAEPLTIAGRCDLVAASPENIAQAIREVEALLPAGATDHVHALRRGLLLRPGVLVFITDADDLKRQDVPVLARLNAGRTRIHVLELNAARDRGESLLRQLAEDNGGTYRRLAPGL